MGSGKGGDTNKQLEDSQQKVANSLSGLLNQEGTQSQQLFNLAFPGMQQSEQFAGALASGSPNLIAAVTAPAAQQVNAAAAGAKKNILETSPAGGERNLALENVDVGQGAELGRIASAGYLNSFNTLANLGQSGVGQSQNAAGTAISAGQEANNVDSGLIQEHMQQKGATLGMYGTLGQSMASGFSGGLGASAGGATSKGAVVAGLGAF